ncbi:chorismate-binding protein [Rufibacter sediminis]|uniref:Chorismate-binding protein n=1 Tax=Rufibacter sediminis TaxID=2762756 RepID=A0ABR6VMQ2_9BACT|nr:chorismate-binding protein [Rufibacter sediminis]MBC3538170.1 chorismate-binding protein [Rufibacter sediminis]
MSQENPSIPPLSADTSPGETAHRLFQAALRAQLPVALWRLPNTQEVQVVVASGVQHALPPMEGPQKGFAFCPFQVSASAPVTFLPADLYFSGKAGTAPELGDTVLPTAFWADFQKSGLKTDLAGKWPSHPAGTVPSIARDAFEKTVSTSIKSMQAGCLEKVVLSRTKTLPLFEGFDLLHAFTQLTQLYATAFVSLVAIPGIGTWLGATPELLVQVDRHRVFRTVALAGTQPLTDGLTPADAIWRQKEIEEQALVQRYIVSCFRHLRLREYVEMGPRTVRAGNLLHLRTDFSAAMDEVGFLKLGTQMLELLHPTSAVGGMPKAAALQMIGQLELHERRYYSGYLGPVQLGQETHLFVNLRCVELGQDTVTAYAGAGMTADSVPAKEWVETELKMQTVLRLFQASES